MRINEPYFSQLKCGYKIYVGVDYDDRYKLFDVLDVVNEHGESMKCVIAGLVRANTYSELEEKVSSNLIFPGCVGDKNVLGIKLVPIDICMEKGCSENRIDEAFCDEHGKMIY